MQLQQVITAYDIFIVIINVMFRPDQCKRLWYAISHITRSWTSMCYCLHYAMQTSYYVAFQNYQSLYKNTVNTSVLALHVGFLKCK